MPDNIRVGLLIAFVRWSEALTRAWDGVSGLITEPPKVGCATLIFHNSYYLQCPSLTVSIFHNTNYSYVSHHPRHVKLSHSIIYISFLETIIMITRIVFIWNYYLSACVSCYWKGIPIFINEEVTDCVLCSYILDNVASFHSIKSQIYQLTRSILFSRKFYLFMPPIYDVHASVLGSHRTL